MSSKIINWNGVSEVLFGKRNVLRSNRVPMDCSEQVSELLEFCHGWCEKHGQEKVFDMANNISTEFVEEPLVKKPEIKKHVVVKKKKVYYPASKREVVKVEEEPVEKLELSQILNFGEHLETIPVAAHQTITNGNNNVILELDKCYYVRASLFDASGNSSVLRAKHLVLSDAFSHSLMIKKYNEQISKNGN